MGKDKKNITPKRKNQKTKNTKRKKKLLTKRYRVENLIASTKKYDRVSYRKERKTVTYLSFAYITLIEYIFRNYKNIVVKK